MGWMIYPIRSNCGRSFIYFNFFVDLSNRGGGFDDKYFLEPPGGSGHSSNKVSHREWASVPYQVGPEVLQDVYVMCGSVLLCVWAV